MDYETGIASSPLDLLNKLATFAGAHGWDALSSATANSYVFATETGPEVFAGVLANSTEWITRGARGHNAGVAYDAQPGNAGQSHVMNLGAGPFTAYHFFVGEEDGYPHIHVVVEVSALQFRHWTLGSLVKFGTWDGGTISDSTLLSDNSLTRHVPESSSHRHICDASYGSNASAHLYIDYDAKVDNWQMIGTANTTTTTHGTGSTRSNGIRAGIQDVGYQRWNFRTPMWPLEYFVNRASSLKSAAGRIPNMRGINVTNFAEGDITVLGSDEWMIFPVFRRQIAAVPNTEVSSGVYGYAYLKSSS